MKAVLDVSLAALELAGSLSGVPYAGAAATALHGIVECCNDVAVHKRKSQELVRQCTQLLNALQEQSCKLEGSSLQEHADEVTAVLERIHNRVKRWSKYNRARSFLKRSEIEEGINHCESELSVALGLFQMNAQIVLDQNQRDVQDMIRSDNAEVRDLLLQILTGQREMRQIVVMQNAEHAAESIMEAGQEELRLLRESVDHTEERARALPESNLPPTPHEGQRYLSYQRGLMNLHRMTGVPPTVKILNGEVTRLGDFAVAGGTYSDVWLGKWMNEEKVALKALRNVKASDSRAKQKFDQELRLWASLDNDHILPFYGIVTDIGQNIHMVSPWQEHGNVLAFVKKNPEVEKSRLLSEAAKGIEYLHESNIIHGNVKCANILVNSKGAACICDFGMSKVIEEVTERTASEALTTSGSARWLAPELIEGSISSPTKASDVYSFAMTILELFTGKYPWAGKRDASVIHDVVVLGLTPPRPTLGGGGYSMPDNIWTLMQECWCRDVDTRPAIGQVVGKLCPA